MGRSMGRPVDRQIRAPALVSTHPEDWLRGSFVMPAGRWRGAGLGLRDVLGDQIYESLAHKGETMTAADMATYAYDQIDQAQAELNAVSKLTAARPTMGRERTWPPTPDTRSTALSTGNRHNSPSQRPLNPAQPHTKHSHIQPVTSHSKGRRP